MNYYQKPVSEILQEFKANSEGLSTKESLLRLEKYGFNRISKNKRSSFILKFLSQFTDLMIVILIAGRHGGDIRFAGR